MRLVCRVGFVLRFALACLLAGAALGFYLGARAATAMTEDERPASAHYAVTTAYDLGGDRAVRAVITVEAGAGLAYRVFGVDAS